MRKTSVDYFTIGHKQIEDAYRHIKFLNVEFPHTTNTCKGDDERRILWLGPNRWLIVEPEHGCLQTLIKNEFNSSEVFLTDLSHGRSTVRLRGRKARDILMKGSGVDWHLNSFGADYCAHTKLFDLAATVDCRDIDVFDIYIARGFAEDFWEILHGRCGRVWLSSRLVKTGQLHRFPSYLILISQYTT